MQRHTTAISQTSTHPPPHLPCQPHRLYCVFFLLESNSLLFNVNAMLATPETSSSRYSSKWCGFLSRCPGPSVPACRFLPVCLFFFFVSFSLSVHFSCFLSLFILFSSCFNFFFFFIPVISGGHRAEAVWVVCLLPDGTPVNCYGWLY